MKKPFTIIAVSLALLTGCTSAFGRLEFTGGSAPESSAPDTPSLELPAPTGPSAVGSAVVDLVDDSRADPWVPSERRRLVTTVWYPAEAPAPNSSPAQYMTPDESRLFMATQPVEVTPEVLGTVTTHSTSNAVPLAGVHTRPLVVLSPGFSFPRATLTGLAEELASRGDVVIGIDHVHESWGTSLPDGSVADCVACEGELDGPTVTAGRAQDISFVLDRVLGEDPMWPGAVSVDPNRVAVGGHSIGGSSAMQTVLADGRVDAGFDLDGTFFPPLTMDVDRPFLILEAAAHPPEDSSIDRTWEHLRGIREREVVPDTTHSSFTDLAPLADALGTPLQTRPGADAMRITRDRVVGFLDRALR